MDLLTCQDCGHGVSPRAAACPSCGGPMAGHAASTTQPESKRLKGSAAIGGIFIVLGIALLVLGAVLKSGPVYFGGILTILAGTVVAALSRLLLWWRSA